MKIEFIAVNRYKTDNTDDRETAVTQIVETIINQKLKEKIKSEDIE